MAYKPYDLEALRAELEHDEGYRAKPYEDSEGILTIGIGHNLAENGLPREIIMELLDRGIDQAEEALDKIWPAWRTLDADRQRVLLNMAFNLGETRLRGFRRMWAALEAGDYETAGAEMKDSQWYRQVGPRAVRLIERMWAP